MIFGRNPAQAPYTPLRKNNGKQWEIFPISEAPREPRSQSWSKRSQIAFVNLSKIVLRWSVPIISVWECVGTGAVYFSPRSAGDSSMFPKRPIWCALIRRRFSQNQFSPSQVIPQIRVFCKSQKRAIEKSCRIVCGTKVVAYLRMSLGGFCTISFQTRVFGIVYPRETNIIQNCRPNRAGMKIVNVINSKISVPWIRPYLLSLVS